jgi:hypothetical protein
LDIVWLKGTVSAREPNDSSNKESARQIEHA